MTDLLTDVLTLDKMEQGQFELELKSTCLDCLVLSTARLFIPNAQAQGLQLLVQSSRRVSRLTSPPKAAPVQNVAGEPSEAALSERKVGSLLKVLGNSASSANGVTGSYRPTNVEVGSSNSDSCHIAMQEQDDLTAPVSPTSPMDDTEDCAHIDIQPILVDPMRLRQILRNLLSNALKFTQRGTVKVSVHCKDNMAHIAVSDTGVGMDTACLARLFRPYVQFANEMQHGQGSGLGLSISKRLALLHGGDLTCNSTPGQGSTFTLHLPLHRPQAGEHDGHMSGRRLILRSREHDDVNREFAMQPHTSSPVPVPANNVQRHLAICQSSLSDLHQHGSSSTVVLPSSNQPSALLANDDANAVDRLSPSHDCKSLPILYLDR